MIGFALEVHREQGPGQLKSTYEQCLAHELKLNGLQLKLQYAQAVNYKGVRLNCGYRADILIKDELIIELESIDAIKSIHEAQLLTCMKTAGIRTGLLMNFNVKKLKDGIRRFVL
ncbi:MAG: GxxExxY protein [Candidatus Thiodiazotropha sp.]